MATTISILPLTLATRKCRAATPMVIITLKLGAKASTITTWTVLGGDPATPLTKITLTNRLETPTNTLLNPTQVAIYRRELVSTDKEALLWRAGTGATNQTELTSPGFTKVTAVKRVLKIFQDFRILLTTATPPSTTRAGRIPRTWTQVAKACERKSPSTTRAPK